ncbi:thioester domain-containing protein [Clostridium septicum]|uniref:thioester domain-containing protein n=1 Tax=Clostridium septicum TaxID=1504 RepID=UPI0032171221
MKYKKSFKLLLMMFILSTIVCTSVKAYTIYTVDEKVTIETENRNLYKVSYENFYLKAKKIIPNNTAEVGYCIDIEKTYPSGEVFSKIDKIDTRATGVLAAGYPNKTKEELGLDNNDEAYFATQIALWSAIEGYDVYKITGDNPKIITAIRNIYNNGINNIVGKNNYESRVYYVNDNIQKVILLSRKQVIEEPPTSEGNQPLTPEENPPIMGK